MSMIQEFKDFALKGNLVDMATGIVIGVAIGTLVTSLVNDIIMPPVGMLLGGVDFANMFITIKEGTTPGPYASLEAAGEAGAVTINIGLFINALISFLIVAFVVFMLIKGMNNLRRKEEEKPAEPPKSEVLLEEIRDALRKAT